MKCLLDTLIKCIFNIQKKLHPLPIWVTQSLCFIDIYLSINELLGAPAVCAATGMSWKQYQSVQTMHRSVYIFTLWSVQGIKNFQLTIMGTIIKIYIHCTSWRTVIINWLTVFFYLHFKLISWMACLESNFNGKVKLIKIGEVGLK